MNHFFIKTPDDARRERENFAMAPVIYKGWSEKSTRSGEGGPRAKADRHDSAQLVQLAEELGGPHKAGHPLTAYLVAIAIEEDQGR